MTGPALSEIEQLRAELRASEERFQAFIERSRDGIFIVDVNGTLLEWNPAQEKLTGIPRAEAIHRPAWELQYRLAPPERRELLQAMRDRVQAELQQGLQLSLNIEDEILRPDGERRYVESVLFALPRAGTIQLVAIGRDTTQRKRYLDELQRSQERLTLALEASGQGLWDWDLATDTAYLSPEYLRITGQSVAEVPHALAVFQSYIHPDDLPSVIEVIDAHVQGKTPRSDAEYRVRLESGEYVWLRSVGRITARDASGAPTRMTGVATDISKRRKLEEALRERQALLLEAERMAHLGHWYLDLRTGSSYWSEEIFRILGLPPAAVPPSHEEFLKQVHPEDRDRMRQAFEATIKDGKTRQEEHRIVTSIGETKTLLATVELERDESGAPSRLIGVELDITERKNLEQALATANRRKDDFLAVLSHELRNPLAPIRSGLYVLQRAPPGSAQSQRMLTVMERQVTHLTRLVDDLLDVTRIGRGKVQLKRERLELGELVRRTVEDHRAAFTANSVQLEGKVASKPMWLDADSTRIAQIVGNLLGNAAKFTPSGGRVEVVLEQDDGKAVLRVTDSGIGIGQELLSVVFEPFMQADRTLDRARGGLGLGLALVKGLVELHGGTVTARSQGLNQGAQFTVRLPLVEPLRQAPEKPVREVQPRRVLVIEDNLDAASSLQEALELDGHEVDVAHNGPDGLALARARQPEIVLCDIGLPEMDGHEVAREFRRDARFDGVYLVALSGYALPEDIQRSHQSGFDRHLAKPVSFEKLEELFAELPGDRSLRH